MTSCSLNLDKEESDEESSHSQRSSSGKEIITNKTTGENPNTIVYEAKVDRNRITSSRGFSSIVKPLTLDSTPNNNVWSFGEGLISAIPRRPLPLIGTHLNWTPPSSHDQDAIVRRRSNVTISITNQVTNHPNQASYKYDVFLSFRGDDTRESFTSTLCYALCVNRVKTFMDVIFKKGNKLDELLKMVEKSRMSIVVFSENFAESEWCLKELVKIFEECNRRGHEVLPVFYNVNPSELRRQDSGKTKKHMDKHINTYGKNSNTVESWSKAIKEFGNLSGYIYRSGRGKLEVELAAEIAQDICTRLHGRKGYIVTSSSKLSDIISMVTNQ